MCIECLQLSVLHVHRVQCYNVHVHVPVHRSHTPFGVTVHVHVYMYMHVYRAFTPFVATCTCIFMYIHTCIHVQVHVYCRSIALYSLCVHCTGSLEGLPAEEGIPGETGIPQEPGFRRGEGTSVCILYMYIICVHV